MIAHRAGIDQQIRQDRRRRSTTAVGLPAHMTAQTRETRSPPLSRSAAHPGDGHRQTRTIE
jgi:hypothetical protein